MVLPPALAFGAFGAKSVGRPPDIDQSSSQIVCPGTLDWQSHYYQLVQYFLYGELHLETD